MVEPGGSFNYLDGNGRTAVDPLKNLSEQLDDPALVKLMGTCHALRDGEFSRTAPTASEPTGRQVLRDAADTRRASVLAVAATKAFLAEERTNSVGSHWLHNAFAKATTGRMCTL